MSSMPNGSGGFTWPAVSFGRLKEEKSSPRLFSDLVTKALKASSTNSQTVIIVEVEVEVVEVGRCFSVLMRSVEDIQACGFEEGRKLSYDSYGIRLKATRQTRLSI